ncbi:hypothetical protein L2E82_02600 [Cichorium intybus]|uniref:Uncharacterized protein n=1 Tax=Cichorium intybus TaxID=13427 RepID=A0ACB9H398_CICIN|nr:hypothetical protein L2E82_02600 [Cichorium intybus]
MQTTVDSKLAPAQGSKRDRLIGKWKRKLFDFEGEEKVIEKRRRERSKIPIFSQGSCFLSILSEGLQK